MSNLSKTQKEKVKKLQQNKEESKKKSAKYKKLGRKIIEESGDFEVPFDRIVVSEENKRKLRGMLCNPLEK